MKVYENSPNHAGMKRFDMKMSKGSGRIDESPKRTFGVNTMSEYYDMNRVDNRQQTLRGQPPMAWDYNY